MASLPEVNEHRQALIDVSTLAQAELVGVWQALDPDNPGGIAEVMRDVMPELANTYGNAAGSLAADFYDDLREQADAPGSYSATVAEAPDDARIKDLVGHGVAPLFIETPNSALALSLLAGGLQSVVAGMDRRTIASSTAADPGRATWRRYASASACAFCALMASRGFAYSSKDAATTVGGGANRLRGTRRVGTAYHDHDRCIAVPEWAGSDVQQPAYVQRWDEAYNKAAYDLRADGRTPDLDSVLSLMRTSLGSH